MRRRSTTRSRGWRTCRRSLSTWGRRFMSIRRRWRRRVIRRCDSLCARPKAASLRTRQLTLLELAMHLLAPWRNGKEIRDRILSYIIAMVIGWLFLTALLVGIYHLSRWASTYVGW